MSLGLLPNLERLLHHWMRRLPMGVVSDLGARLAWMKIRFVAPDVAQKARRNLRWHLPQSPDSDIEDLVWRFVSNVGRLMAEFSIVHRFDPAKHIEFVGVHEAKADVGRIPTIALCLHLANWEIIASGMKSIGVPIASVAELPASAVHREIATKVRMAQNVRLLTPDLDGLLRVMSILKANGVVAMFGDDKRNSNMMGPLFGRPAHLKGNLAMAARLARRTGAQIIVAYCVRIGKIRFRLHFSKPIRLNCGECDPHADVDYLNSLIEPIILQHLDQWYYLDDAIEPIV